MHQYTDDRLTAIIRSHSALVNSWNAFDVSLIPETLERTNLGGTAVGRTVNLEVDVVAKYVEKLVGVHAR